MSINDSYDLWFAWRPVRLHKPEWHKYKDRLVYRVWLRFVFRKRTGGKTYYSLFPPS